MADAESDNRHNQPQAGPPAKVGTEPAREKASPSGDSPKPHGDKLQHATDEAAQPKK
jgi:hypothetical protein